MRPRQKLYWCVFKIVVLKKKFILIGCFFVCLLFGFFLLLLGFCLFVVVFGGVFVGGLFCFVLCGFFYFSFLDYMCVCMSVFVYVCMYICMCMYVCTYVCVCVCVCVCV